MISMSCPSCPSRRSFIRAGAGLAAIIAAGKAPAAFIRSMIAARSSIMPSVGGGTPTAKSYVQTGLLALYDGIENIGLGTHDAAARTWVDLSGNGNDGALPSGDAFTWGSNCIVGHGAGYVSIPMISNVQTIETCIKLYPQAGAPTVATFTDGIFWISNFLEDGTIFGGNLNANIAQNYHDELDCTERFSASMLDGIFYVNGSRKVANIDAETYVSEVGSLLGDEWDDVFDGECYSIRVYNRALTAAEIAANCAIDKARFNLPD